MKARNCRIDADDSVVARSDVNGLAVRDVKLREAEGAMERYWLVRVGARRAKREQRAIFAGGTSSRGSFKLADSLRLGLKKPNARKRDRSKNGGVN